MSEQTRHIIHPAPSAWALARRALADMRMAADQTERHESAFDAGDAKCFWRKGALYFASPVKPLLARLYILRSFSNLRRVNDFLRNYG